MNTTDTADISDLYDAFHRLASVLWQEFGRENAADEDDEGIPFDELMDQLELDVFLPACARRLRQRFGQVVEPDEVGRCIRLYGADGPLPGAAGQYHSHAFHPESLAGDVPNAVLAADLMPRARSEVRLVLTPERSGYERRRRRPQLPVN